MQIDFNKSQVNLPDFLVVGAAKSATTSLYFYLKKNPGIFLPEIKETSFFALKNQPFDFLSPPELPTVKNEKDYFELFDKATDSQKIGEISPAYLYSYEETLKNIKFYYGEAYRDIKIIIILRNPIERIFSQYMMFKRDELESLELADAINQKTIENRLNEKWNFFYDYVGFSKYFDQVNFYMNNFEHVKIVLFEDFSSKTSQYLEELSAFIGVQYFDVNTKTKFNKSGEPRSKFLHKLLQRKTTISRVFRLLVPKETRLKIRHIILSKNLKSPELSKEEYQILLKLMKDDINRLEKLINKDLSHWLK